MTMFDGNDNQEPSTEDLAHLGSFEDVPSAQEHALVVLAMGQPCWVWPEAAGGYSLHVLPEQAAAIRRELAIYTDEQHQSAERHRAPLPITLHPAGWTVYALWAISLITVFILQQSFPGLTDAASSSSLGIIDHHQWWRPFTALFLHADTSHLLGNLLSGCLFMLPVARSVGPLRGWSGMLACGTLGNIATAVAAYPSSFSSIGASTAVFAALGILSGTGLHLMMRHRLQLPWLRVASPLLGGIILLGMLGSEQPGDNTDVIGHVFGFTTGVICGLMQGHAQHRS